MIRSDGFNDDILAAGDRLFRDHGGRGYDIGSYFTHDLVYGDGEVIPANHAPLPGVLIEPFFGDNRANAERGAQRKDALAQAVVAAFQQFVAVPVG